uniref:Uncharacterized protein n=1 Tax=Arundo donax TaxID=35708 RepID=A0A0A9BPS3_ARUDO
MKTCEFKSAALVLSTFSYEVTLSNDFVQQCEITMHSSAATVQKHPFHT